MSKVVQRTVSPELGADPELFLATSEGVIGAERVIDEKGLQVGDPKYNGPKAVLDGVQLELHPQPSTCRQSLASSLASIFIALQTKLTAEGGKVKASFDPVVTVSKKEMDSLSDAAKTLGCTPSLNTHNPKATVRLAKKDERMRSAGGHLHFGLRGYDVLMKLLKDKKEVGKLTDLFDVLVGLPSVLIDRDPNQAKRRRVYGRAGEYRLPPHGIEYRTPSNFWLRHYYLLSYIFGQGRQAINIWAESQPEFLKWYYDDKNQNWNGRVKPTVDFASELLALIDMPTVVKAINRNDLELAQAEWEKVAPFLKEYLPQDTLNGGVHGASLENFNYFAEKVQSNGLAYWFPRDPMAHWSATTGDEWPGRRGFESFLAGTVASKRLSSLKKAA